MRAVVSYKVTELPQKRKAPHMPTAEETRTKLRRVNTFAKILIGPEESMREVPKELLTVNSSFFRAALEGSFTEGVCQTIKLPEDRADVWDYFVSWLYTRRLDHEAVDAVEPTKPAYFWLLHLYCMVDKFEIEDCKNAIVNKLAKLAEETNSVPTPTDTWIIFETFGAQPENPMRKLVVDLFAWKRTDNLLDTHEDSWHERFLRDLVVRMKREDCKSTIKPWTTGMCKYHEHSNTKGEKCSR